MGKLRVFSGQDVCHILERPDFAEVRGRSSHIVMQSKDEVQGTKTIPVPDHKELRIGTLRSIIRQSGVARGEFEVNSDQ